VKPSRLGAVILVRIKQERLKRKLTQRELARRAGVQQSMISRLESGVGKLPLHEFERIAAALGVSPLALLRHVKDVD